jgi:TetR/AcrR family transcriptional repressor of mexJK operon
MPHQVLTLLGESFLHTISSEPMAGLQRLLVTSAADFPGIGPAFYDNGPGLGLTRLAAYLQRETDVGRLTITDPTLAAEQFFGMLIGHIALKRLLRIQQPVSEAEIRHRVDTAVTTFLRAYSPAPAAR